MKYLKTKTANICVLNFRHVRWVNFMCFVGIEFLTTPIFRNRIHGRSSECFRSRARNKCDFVFKFERRHCTQKNNVLLNMFVNPVHINNMLKVHRKLLTFDSMFYREVVALQFGICIFSKYSPPLIFCVDTTLILVKMWKTHGMSWRTKLYLGSF